MLPHLRLLQEKEDAAEQEIQKPEFKKRVLAASEGLTRMVLTNPESEEILEAKLDCLRILKELEQKSSEQEEESDLVKKIYREMEKNQKKNPNALLRVKPRKVLGEEAPDAFVLKLKERKKELKKIFENRRLELAKCSNSDEAQEVSKKNFNYGERLTRLMKVLGQCPGEASGEMKRASTYLDNFPALEKKEAEATSSTSE